MTLAVIESRYAGEVARNVEYARVCMCYAIDRNMAPFASHLLYTQEGILADELPSERDLGIRLGYAWAQHAHVALFFCRPDETMSEGMKAARYRWTGKMPMVFIKMDQRGMKPEQMLTSYDPTDDDLRKAGFL